MARSTKPLAGYLRLTEDRGGRKIGTKIQKRVILHWALSQGLEIAHFYDDTNITAADEKVHRPQYEEMLEECRAGRFGGIAVFKIDRLTRVVMQFETSLRAVRCVPGGLIAEANTGRTTESIAGVQMLRQEVSNAESEIENMRQRVLANKQERARQGHYHGGGRRPFGFAGAKKTKDRRITNSGKIGVKHKPGEVQLIQEAARRRLEGETYPDIIRDWHEREIKTVTGSPWSSKTMETMLTSPRMIGKRVHRETDPLTSEITETMRKAKWKPVLELDQWERLCALKTPQAHAPIADYPLSGFALCGRCRKPLTGARRNYKRGDEVVGVRTYRCRGQVNDKARGHCGALSVVAEEVEKLIAARILLRISRTRGLVGQVVDETDPKVELIRLAEEIEYCETELEELAKVSERGDAMLSVAQLMAYRKPFVERIERATTKRHEIKRMLDVPTPDPSDYRDLPAWWERLTAGQQQRLIEDFFEEIVVLPPGRSGRYFKPDRVVATPSRPEDSHSAVD